jgi:hypothetical protein
MGLSIEALVILAVATVSGSLFLGVVDFDEPLILMGR